MSNCSDEAARQNPCDLPKSGPRVRVNTYHITHTLEDRNATAIVEATARIVRSKLSLEAQRFRKSRSGKDLAGNTWFTKTLQRPPVNTPYMCDFVLQVAHTIRDLRFCGRRAAPRARARRAQDTAQAQSQVRAHSCYLRTVGNVQKLTFIAYKPVKIVKLTRNRYTRQFTVQWIRRNHCTTKPFRAYRDHTS